MACFIIPVQFSRKRTLSPTEKAEYALIVAYYKSHCGAVSEEIEERAKVYAQREGRYLGWPRCHDARQSPADWLADMVPLHARALVQIGCMSDVPVHPKRAPIGSNQDDYDVLEERHRRGPHLQGAGRAVQEPSSIQELIFGYHANSAV